MDCYVKLAGFCINDVILVIVKEITVNFEHIFQGANNSNKLKISRV